MQKRTVYLFDSKKELVKVAECCYYDRCSSCRFKKTCIGKSYLWCYEGVIEYTPYQLYEKICLREE